MSPFTVEDIPKTALPQEPTAFDTPPQAGDPALGIPQSSAAPDFMGETFGSNPWDAEEKAHEEALGAWYRAGVENLDKAVLDPDTAFKDADLSFAADRDEARRLVINDSWLELNHDEPVAPDELQRRMQIQKVSLARFGEMVDSDEALFPLIEKDATKRKDTRELGRDLTVAAYDDAMLPSDQAPGFGGFREKLKAHAGYDSEREADYLEAWHETRRDAKERVDAFREPLVTVWRAFKMDGNITAAAMDAYAKLTPEQRPEFMDALAIRAKALPEEERKTFWQNMGKVTGQAVSDYGRNAAESMTSNVQKGGAVGWEDFLGSNEAVAARNASDAKTREDFQLRRNFAADVRKVAREDYDPLKSAFGEGKPGFWEGVAYQAPGVTATSLTMAVPYVGMATMALSMEGSAYEQMRGRMLAAGKTDEESTAIAEGLAPFIAAPQVALEKIGFGLWSRKMPGLSKAIDSIGDQITNRLRRGAVKTGIIGTAETAIELAQDSLVYTVQDIAAGLSEDIPDVDWGKELSGTWASAPEIFFTMLPLSILGAAGGLSAESRHAAFSRATTTELQALGINTEGIAAINAANGPSSLASAVDSAMTSRDPNSEEAIAAVGALKLQLETQRQARSQLDELGYSAPSFVQSPEGITVFDGEGKELGSAPDLSGAVRIARANTVALDDMQADQVAVLGSLMEAARAAVELDPSSTVEVNLGEFDPSQATPEMAARFAAQVALKEQAEGGTGDIARSVLGYSATEMAQGVRQTVNRLFKGAAVTDVFHETFHGLRRQARASGTITKPDEIAMLRALDTVLAGKTTKDGTQLRFIPEGMTDEQVSGTLLDEAFSEIAEMEILRTRKGQGKGKLGLTRGVISRNLTALTKLMPGTIGKWTAFMQAVRARWGLSLSRALAMKKAERDGTFDKTDYDAYLDKLLGLDQQVEHDAGVQSELDRILGLPEEIADDDIPFSIGRAMVNPTAETRTFEGAQSESAFSLASVDGVPSVGDYPESGPAFSIGLASVHNLSAENLAFADKIGGLAVPSIAVVPAGNVIDGFGEINLIGGRPLADPTANPVFDADAYTARWPEAEYKKSTMKRVQPLIDQLQPYANRFGRRIIDTVWDNSVNKAKPEQIIDTLKRDDSAKAAFVGLVIGQELEPVMMPDPSGKNGDHPALLEMVARHGDGMYSEFGNIHHQDMTQAALAAYDSQTESFLSKIGNPDERKRKAELRARIRADMTDSSGLLTHGHIRSIRESIKNFGKMIIDTSVTSPMLEKALLGREAEFYRWLETTILGLFDEPRLKLKGKFVPYTIENIVAAMTAGKVNNQEKTMTFGEGSLRAMNSRQFDDLEEMRSQAAKGIVSEEDAKTTRAELTERLGKWREAVAEFYKHKSTWDAFDNSMQALGKFLKGARTDARMASQLRSMDFEGVPKALIKEAMDIGQKFMDAPVPYFESKPQRVVRLNEFSAAIVPRSTTQETLAILERHGIKVEILSGDSWTNQDARKVAMQKLAGESAFSIGPAKVAGILSDNALARITDPRRRTHVMSRIARDFNAMRLQIERITSLSGIRRSKGDLRREAAAREELAAEEKIGLIHQRFGSLLADEDLVKIKQQPVNSYLATTRADGKLDPFRGRLKSKAQAIKDSPDLFQLHRVGDYDGSDGVSRSVFGGTLMPDQAAQELYDNHLIKEPTADAMWEALMGEQNTVAKFKEMLVQAQEQIRAAKLEAKQETNEWLATQGKDQEVNFSDKEEIRRSLRMLDAILLALPAEIRGKIGGYTQISMIATDEARLAYLKDKLSKADKELETYLRVEYAKEWEALLAKAAPKSNEAGQRPTGSIAADAYDIFRIAEAAMGMSFAEGEAEADKWDAIADHPDTEEKDIDLARVKAQMIRLTMNWNSADAARREQAVLEGDKIYFDGLRGLAIENSRRRERLGKLRTSAIKGTGKTGGRMEREAARQAAASKGGESKSMVWELLSFGQLVNVLFGEKSDAGKWFNAREIAASNAAYDGFQAKANSLESLFDTLSGNRFDGEKLRHRMATAPTIKVKDALGADHTFTDSQAITFLLMWRQADGKRHMEGLADEETGAIISTWGWNDDAAASIESQLSREGQAVMAFLGSSYGEEYGRINEVFRRIWNVSMPRHKMYAPLSVNPVQGKGDSIMDPVSGDTIGAGMTPGSLKNRSFSAIVEPEFKDAFQVYLQHARQMEHFIAYGEFSRDALGVINRWETRGAILAAGGPAASATLSKWVDYFALGGLHDANMGSAWTKVIGGMLGRVSQAALVGRVSVLCMQSLQLGAAAFKMPVGSFLTRIAKLTTGQLGWGDAIRSEYIQRRMNQMPPVVRDMMAGMASGTPNRAKFLATMAGRSITGADGLFTAGTYAIFYDYHLKLARQAKDATPEATAHREAERLTDQVAQPTRTGARSWLEVANQGNPAFRAAWNFSSDPRQKMSLFVYESMRRDISGGEKAMAAGKSFGLVWIVGGVLATLLRTISRDLRNDDDDEIFDERYWNPYRLGLMAAMGPLGGVPFLGGMLEDSTYKATGQFMPRGGMLGFLADGAALPRKWSNGKIEPLKDLETLATAGAGFSGTSAAAASAMHLIRDLVGIAENIEGPD